MPDFIPIPYRIRIGVTGHRTIENPDAFETVVRRAIDAEVEQLFPAQSRLKLEQVRRLATTAISYRVLSPLAEGADRVVARAVLRYPGARLDVALPLTVDDYLEDFDTEESRSEFRELLALCRRPTELRTRSVRDDRRDPADQAELRREAYRQIGQYVVDHCDVLIAAWDGEPARGRGGTAEIVRYATEQKRPIIRVWHDQFELVNRADNNGLDASALDGIDRFNRYPIAEARRQIYIRNLDRDYFESPAAGMIPAVTRDFVNRCLFSFYTQASIMAKESQSKFYRAGRFIYGFSAVAVACAAIGILFPDFAWYSFSAELLLLIFISIALRQARGRHSHQSWIENRLLTERIRCGTFMAICGVEPRPIEVLPYMGHSQTVNDWMIRVFDEIWDRLPPLTGCGKTPWQDLNSYVRETWIGHQVQFHEAKKQREGKARRHLARAGEIVLPATIVAAAWHLLLLAWKPSGEALEYWLHQILGFVTIVFPAAAASLAGMEAHREHLRLEKRSANMAPQLERLDKQMASATDPARFEALLQQVDELLLRETQDWLMLMRYVEIKAS